jgi:molybdenum cofactor cytidylyltransferase
VVLAAGLSARLGAPKALARVHGWSLLRRTLYALAPSAASRIIVVIPPRSARYQIGSSRRSVAFVANPHRASGLSTSVRLGVHRARYSAAILLLPVDLVDLRRRDIARLIARWRGARRSVVAHRVRSGAAAPLILPRWLYARVLGQGQPRGVDADHGLRDLVRRLPEDRVALMRLPSAESDVDTAQDLARARRRIRARV